MPPASAAAADPPLDGARPQVMLVDDEAMVVRVVTRLLERAGYQVTVFLNPSEALEAIRRTPAAWDVLLTDMTMPGLSGTELAEGAAAAGSTMPVVLLSGWVDSQAEQAAHAAGVARILSKPVQVNALVDIVAELTESTRH